MKEVVFRTPWEAPFPACGHLPPRGGEGLTVQGRVWFGFDGIADAERYDGGIDQPRILSPYSPGGKMSVGASAETDKKGALRRMSEPQMSMIKTMNYDAPRNSPARHKYE